MLSDACHDFAYGDSNLKTLIEQLDHYEKKHRAIHSKELIDALRKLAERAQIDTAGKANLARACLDVRNHYDEPRMVAFRNGRELANHLLRRYS